MEWLYIIIGWIFLNVIVKLLVNSIERIFRDKIDQSVRKAPVVLGTLLVELFRFALIIYFIPIILLDKLIPDSINLYFIQEVRFSIKFLLIKERFHQYFPFLFFALIHPFALISEKRQEELREEWLKKQNIDAISDLKNNKRRLTRRSS